VKKLEITFSSFKYKGITYGWLWILFIVIFYLFLIKILNSKKISEDNKQKELDNLEKRKQEIKNIYNELLTLSDKAEKYSQEQFYTELNNLFRRFFLYIWIDKADKKTLSELNKDNIDRKILDIFTTSYIYEFSTKVDSLSERKQIVMNFMIFLKK
jgi:Ca2+/Na+ antiporter